LRSTSIAVLTAKNMQRARNTRRIARPEMKPNLQSGGVFALKASARARVKKVAQLYLHRQLKFFVYTL